MNPGFSLSPRAYNAWFTTPQGKRALEEERALFHRLLWKERGSLLDIGCGTGIFTSFLRDLGFSTTGLDLSREMLLHLKEKGPDLPLVQGNAQLLPFERNAFHYITLITVLEFLPHPFYALTEAARVARRGILLGHLPPLAPSNLKRRLRALAGRSSFKQARFFPFSRCLHMIEEACGISGRKVKTTEKGACLYPPGLKISTLAAFELVRVDYE